MKDVYGIEIQNIKESKVITIDSTSKEQKKAMVSSDSAIKATTKFIAKTIDRVKKGSYVVVILLFTIFHNMLKHLIEVEQQ